MGRPHSGMWIVIHRLPAMSNGFGAGICSRPSVFASCLLPPAS